MKKSMREKIFDFIAKRYASTGRPPTRSEIARKLDTSPQNVDKHIQMMIRDGLLKKVEVPVYGNVIPNI